MAPGGGHLQGPFGGLLALDLGKIHAVVGPGQDGGPGSGHHRLAPLQVIHELQGVADAVDRDAAGKAGLLGVFRRDIQLLDAAPGGPHSHGERPRHGAQLAAEGQLPHKGHGGRRGADGAGGDENAEHDGQVVHGAGFFDVGRGQIYVHMGAGELKAAAFYRRGHPLPGLPDGGVRQAADLKFGQTPGDIALHGHIHPVYARYAEGTDSMYHVRLLSQSCRKKRTRRSMPAPEIISVCTANRARPQKAPRRGYCPG